jgi:uncharacterized protein (DUF924 family)/sugar lactone lactonase YvrE
MMTPDAVLDFWFAGDPTVRRSIWFQKSVPFDSGCHRFLDTLREAKLGRLDSWADTPRGALALLIVLDQMSRNLFRGLPETYAADSKARAVAREALRRGFDQQVGPVERMFFYLPLVHSEYLADQDEATRLFKAVREELGEPSDDHGRGHRDVIRRFGRFPHRNAILGRVNTPEEDVYLAEPGAGFGPRDPGGHAMNELADQDHEIGSGEYRYRFRRNWAKPPRWWNFGDTDVTGPPQTCVKGAVAPNGDVYVLSRAAHPVMVFDAEGRFVSSWGEGVFSSFVHGMTIDPAGHVWITDTGLHTVTEHTADGKTLRTLGTHGAASPTLYGKPFNMPTGVTFASNGDVFVSDGYGNRRVHCFSAEGELKHSWGEPGDGPGQFALVHFITADAEDRLYVCDRENHRIQIFATTGEVLAQWTGFVMPSDLAFGREAIYVAAADGVSVWTRDRRKLLHIGRDEPFAGAMNVHGIWIDGDENIYLAQFDRAVSKLSRM